MTIHLEIVIIEITKVSGYYFNKIISTTEKDPQIFHNLKECMR